MWNTWRNAGIRGATVVDQLNVYKQQNPLGFCSLSLLLYQPKICVCLENTLCKRSDIDNATFQGVAALSALSSSADTRAPDFVNNKTGACRDAS